MNNTITSQLESTRIELDANSQLPRIKIEPIVPMVKVESVLDQIKREPFVDSKAVTVFNQSPSEPKLVDLPLNNDTNSVTNSQTESTPLFSSPSVSIEQLASEMSKIAEKIANTVSKTISNYDLHFSTKKLKSIL